jgi:hypothetical protein
VLFVKKNSHSVTQPGLIQIYVRNALKFFFVNSVAGDLQYAGYVTNYAAHMFKKKIKK